MVYGGRGDLTKPNRWCCWRFKDLTKIAGAVGDSLLCNFSLQLPRKWLPCVLHPSLVALGNRQSKLQFQQRLEIARRPGGTRFHVKSPVVVAGWPSTCPMPTKSPMELVFCMHFACRPRRKQHHGRNCSKMTPFGE